jgi:uncharacterized membrane protein YsdA (DUF1294 family)
MPRWGVVLGLAFVLGHAIPSTTAAATQSTSDSLPVRSIVITTSPELTAHLDALVETATKAIKERDEGKRHGAWGAVFGVIMFFVTAVPLASFVWTVVMDKKKTTQDERASAAKNQVWRILGPLLWVLAVLLCFVGAAFVASSFILPIAVLLLALAAWGHLLLAVATNYEQLRWLMSSQDVRGNGDKT